MQRKRFSNTNRWWRYPLLAAGLVVSACSSENPTDTPEANPPVIMPVDAGTNEYNLIDRFDPNGTPACTVLNLCHLEIRDAGLHRPESLPSGDQRRVVGVPGRRQRRHRQSQPLLGHS